MQLVQKPIEADMLTIFGEEEIFSGSERVFKCLVDNQPAYVKKSEKTKRHIGHHLQGLLYYIFKDPILIPTVLNKDEDDIKFQVDKMRALKQNGIHVPDVLFVSDTYFVMSDEGECVKDYLRRHSRQMSRILSQATKQMAKLHQKNFIHGGAQIKNFVIKNGVVSLIDFEEKVHPKYIDAFKVRDMLVFLLSLERGGFITDIEKLCALYQRLTKVDIYGELAHFFKKYRWLSFLNHKAFDFLSMKDVRAFLNLMKRFND